MSAAWVAGSVRARSLSQRRLGAGGARALARSLSVAGAVDALHATPYGHDVHSGQSLAEAQHAVWASVLWHLRVLAGWQPSAGTEVLRILAAGFEIANLEDRLCPPAERDERDGAPRYRLGALETAWSRLVAVSSPGQAQQVLCTSAWGDPGGASVSAIQLGMRLAWADRVVERVPEAAGWARAATALLLAGHGLGGPPLTETSRLRAAYVLGPEAVEALLGGATPAELTGLLPKSARWAFEGVAARSDLWQAEAGWWRHVEREAFAQVRGSRLGRTTLVGAAALLAVDAWRVCAALETAARGGSEAWEAFDGVA